jgi:SAM-dependent methyltransferase
MSEKAMDSAITALPLSGDPWIVDTGCGGGEILLRALRAHPGARGLGVDIDPEAIAEARSRARGLPVQFEVRDAGTVDGGFDAAVNVASSHVHDGFPAVLDALHGLAPVVLYGEGFWQRSPTPAFLAALGDAAEDELADLDGLREAVRKASFEILHEWFANQTDWQRYEEALAARAERHGTTESRVYAQRIRERRSLPGGADTLGFALLVLRRL